MRIHGLPTNHFPKPVRIPLNGAVPVVMTTHKARERNVRKALREIDRLDIVQDKTVLIRIEDEERR